MPRPMQRLTAAFMSRLLAPDRQLRREMKAAPQETPEAPCLDPDCKKPCKTGFCSAECAKRFKQNFRAVGGYNVRIDQAH